MKRHLIFALLLIPILASAQNNFDLQYDPQTVTTVTGTVLSPIFYNPANPAAGPQAVVISSGGVAQTVFLGPGWYVNQFASGLRTGEVISVTASRRIVMGSQYLVASTVTSGGRTFALRTSNGIPLWGVQSNYLPPAGAGMVAIDLPYSTTLENIDGMIISSSLLQTTESTVPYRVTTVRASDTGSLWQVVLAPDSYLSQKGIGVARGAFIVVTGARVKLNGERALVATTVGQRTDVVQLRMIQGTPVFPVTPLAGAAF